jgi:hypothetical protein
VNLCQVEQKDIQAMSRPKLKVTVGLLKGHTTLRAHIFKVRLTQQQVCQMCSDEKKILYILCVTAWQWHAKDKKNPGLCVPEAQGSRKYEGDLS